MSLNRGAFVAGSAAAGVAFTTRSARAQASKIRIGIIPIDAGAQVFYAEEMGFFRRAGLDVEIVRNTNGGVISTSVLSNALDIGYTNLVSLSIAFSKGLPLTVIAPAGLYNDAAPTSALMVAANSPIANAAELRGKIVATNGLRTITELAPKAWIDKNGGDSAAVKFVELTFPEMPGALAQGRVDAALIAEPMLTASKGTTKLLADVYTSVAKEFLISCWCTTERWATEHRDVVKRFDDVMRETAVWANANHARSAEILVKYARLDPKIAATMTRSRYAQRLEPQAIQPSIDVAARYGFVASAFPAQKLIYTALK